MITLNKISIIFISVSSPKSSRIKAAASDLEAERMAYALFAIKCDLKNLGFDPR